MRVWCRTLSIAALALMVPWSVEAACAPADAAGTWDAYSVGADGSGLFWNRCTIKLNSSARLQSGSSCVSDFGATSTLSGQLTVSSSCRISGSFTQRFSAGSTRCNLPQATLSRNKETVNGVTKCDGGAAIASFNMVKR
jgi:hypothetical protein